MDDAVLALDIGGTKIRGALVRAQGSAFVAEQVTTAPTPAAEGPAAVLAATLDLADRVRGSAAIRAAGIASAGVIDTDAGRVTHATGALPGWAGTELARPLAEHLGVPVRVINDVHAHGIGEARFGAGASRSSMLLVAVGTGIGGCHVIAGSPVVGARGVAGHLGHVPVPGAETVPCPCGRTGHLEGLASGPGILRLAGRLGAVETTGDAVTDGRRLAREARAGDRAAGEAYRIAGLATGRVIGALLNTLDPEIVALTGGVAEAGGSWPEAVREGIAHEAMDAVAGTPVTSAVAGDQAALLGAAAHATDHLHLPRP